MSLVDITPLPAEDELMDPATKQYLDSSLSLAEARSDAKLADFRATMEAYTARADERESAARERLWAEAFERRMDGYAAREDEHHAVSLARFDQIERRLDRIEIAVIGMKRFVVGASLSTVLGVAAFNAALIQNYHAAFDSAHYLSAAEQDLAAQRKRTDALLAAMQKMNGQPASPP